MKNCTLVFALLATLGLALFAGTASASNVITGVTASASTEQNANNAPTRTTDGSGLGALPLPATHDTQLFQHWVTLHGTPLSSQWIQWDLGALYELDTIQVWNYNQNIPPDYTNRGINQVDIYTSSVAGPGDPEGVGAVNWNALKLNATFTKASGLTGYTGFDLATEISTALPGSAVQWVRFEIDTNHGDSGNYVGMSEIRFFGEWKESVINPGIVAVGDGSGYDITGNTARDWTSYSGGLDIDSDGQLGSDGWIFYADKFNGSSDATVGGTLAYVPANYEESLPSYISTHAAGANFLHIGRFWNMDADGIDDPTTPSTLDRSGCAKTVDNGAADSSGEVMTFNVSGLPALTTVRVGVFSGNQGPTGGEWQPTSVTLSGGTSSATVSALPINPGGTAYQDSRGAGMKDTVLTGGWVFFDIDADGTYAVSGTQRTAGGGYSIGALTFDSVIITSLYSTTDGDWDAAGTWDAPPSVPTADIDVVVQSGHTVTVTGGADAGKSLSITGTGSTVNVEGILTIDEGISVASDCILDVEGTLIAPSGVSIGGTLSGDGSITANVVVTSAELAPGSDIGILTVTGNLSLAANSLYDWEVGDGTLDLTAVTGNLSLASWGLKIIDVGGDGALGDYLLFTYTGTSVFAEPFISTGSDLASLGWDTPGMLSVIDGGPGTGEGQGVYLHVIPEPSTLVLLVSGLLTLLLFARRRRR